jgi:integrase
MRYSSYPPELRKFVKSVERNAQAAGKSDTLARIFGAWAACFVRYCTVNDRSWREAEHVPAFLRHLDAREDVDAASQDRAAESIAFLFERLLRTDLGTPAWHPDRRTAAADAASSQDPTADPEEDGQSALLTRLLFHTSLPINEALDLRAGDVDLDAGLIYVSDPMGTPRQIVDLPDALRAPFRRHLKRLRAEHGPRYFDAPLFQAQALQGRPGGEAPEDAAGPPSAPDADEEPPADRPASLWSYAEES